jgi:hypothetical protein
MMYFARVCASWGLLVAEFIGICRGLGAFRVKRPSIYNVLCDSGDSWVTRFNTLRPLTSTTPRVIEAVEAVEAIEAIEAIEELVSQFLSRHFFAKSVSIGTCPIPKSTGLNLELRT